MDDRNPALAERSQAWHSLTVDETLARLGSERHGLSAGEAARRLARYGPNRLPAGKRRSALMRLAAQFHSILIYVLFGSAIIAAALGHWIDSAVILLVLIINAAIGYVQEGRAEEALEAVREILSPHASVLRDGERRSVCVDALVPGDVVLLDAGDRVPADLRLIRTHNLHIDEAALTGESLPVEKHAAPVAENAAIGDRTCMAFSGTLAVSGRGSGIVVATALQTELGRISKMLGEIEPLTTPLLRQMNLFARQLTVLILAGSAAIFALAYFVRSYSLPDAFMAVLGLAVAAIPEGLPAVMTITLAIGVRRMAARNAIIRRLPAVETLGSVSVICSDKTGTLTRNEMTVASAATADGDYRISGAGYEPRGEFMTDGHIFDPRDSSVLLDLARAALLCNDATLREGADGWRVEGDPMEGALLSFGMKAGHDLTLVNAECPRLDEIPFDARHRFMATLHSSEAGSRVVYVKGAPERIVAMCSWQMGRNEPQPIDRKLWLERIEALASQGQRVLALAAKPMRDGTSRLAHSDLEHGVVLLGILGLIDPPRPEAIAAIAECRSAGIDVKMITGDHAATARAIARELGLPHHEAMITGHNLDALDGQALRQTVAKTGVFARTSPEHKFLIVEALQADGRIVAMTGDGVNDAPALKRADVGIAMGRKGTEAAKEASEMVLADDNFASIVAAVREGRTVYDNLKKVIGWTLPTNMGESLAIIAAILFGLLLPVSPVQILWINMVTAVALGLTLAFEPTEPGTMRRPPRRPDDPMISGFLWWRICFVALLFLCGTFGMFYWALERGLDLAEARTIVVNTIVVLEIFYLFSVRYLHATSLTWTGVVGTPAVLIGVGVITIAQFAFTYAPFMQTIFGTRAVSFADGLFIIGVGVALLLVLELEKLVRRSFGWSEARF
jgi:magnesium-transporting ATPase (P-type)